MSHKSRDASQRILYGLYDKDDSLVFVGNMEEVMKFTGCARSTVNVDVCRGRKIQHKYTIVKIGHENITEKRCYRCGKTLPVTQFVWYNRPCDGKYVPRSICKSCKYEESREHYYKQYERRKFKRKMYHVYEGDELVFVGTGKEVANFACVTIGHVYKCASTNAKLLGTYRLERKREE